MFYFCLCLLTGLFFFLIRWIIWTNLSHLWWGGTDLVCTGISMLKRLLFIFKYVPENQRSKSSPPPQKTVYYFQLWKEGRNTFLLLVPEGGKQKSQAKKNKNRPDLPARTICVCICSLILTRSTGAPRPTDTRPVSMLATVRSAMLQGCRPSP